MQQLKCNRCGGIFPETSFSVCRAKKTGRQNRCKACDYLHNKEWREKNPEKFQKRREDWQKTAKKTIRNTQLQYYYGIDLQQYTEMLEAQGGGCAICGKTPEENGKELAVDHCHEHGHVRQLLCTSCNKGLGLFQDKPELLFLAAAYLEKHDGRNKDGITPCPKETRKRASAESRPTGC